MRKDGNRPLRVAELIRRELATLIPRVLDDPRANQATITYVDVSPDLKSAKIYFTLLAGQVAADPVLAIFKKSAAHLRRELAARVALRVVPDLKFYFDESIERGDRVSRLIDKALHGDREGGEK